MTGIIVHKLSERLNIDINETYLQVSWYSASIIGTSANL